MSNTDNQNGVIFSLKNLAVEIPVADGVVNAVNQISLEVERGKSLGLVGESGCGKTISCLAALGLLNKKIKVSGQVFLDGIDFFTLGDEQQRVLRGNKIGLIMQNPTNAFNPLLTIEEHFKETFKSHVRITTPQITGKVKELLKKVGLEDNSKILKQYPLQLSGGMLQRVMIALALALKPVMLIADEPTTALDRTMQVRVLNLIEQLRKEDCITTMLVSHDMNIINRYTDRVAVMYCGYIVEQGPTKIILNHPLHPYTRGLISSRLRFSRERLKTIPGQPASLLNLGTGCPFYNRCEQAVRLCPDFNMALTSVGHEHEVSCVYTGPANY